MTEKLTVEEALAKAELIDRSIEAIYETAPQTLAAIGGRDALAKLCQMTVIGPVPRLTSETWERMSGEYEGRRGHGSTN